MSGDTKEVRVAPGPDVGARCGDACCSIWWLSRQRW